MKGAGLTSVNMLVKKQRKRPLRIIVPVGTLFINEDQYFGKVPLPNWDDPVTALQHAVLRSHFHEDIQLVIALCPEGNCVRDFKAVVLDSSLYGPPALFLLQCEAS